MNGMNGMGVSDMQGINGMNGMSMHGSNYVVAPPMAMKPYDPYMGEYQQTSPTSYSYDPMGAMTPVGEAPNNRTPSTDVPQNMPQQRMPAQPPDMVLDATG